MRHAIARTKSAAFLDEMGLAMERDRRTRRGERAEITLVLVSELGMRSTEIPPLEGFSLEQQSMIASAIAGAQPLCCDVGRAAVETITDELGAEVRLHHFAATCLGCQLVRRKPEERDAFITRYLARLVVALA